MAPQNVESQLQRTLTSQVNKSRVTEQSHASDSSYVNVGSAPEIQSLLDNFAIKQADPRIPCFMMETFVRHKDFYGRQDTLKALDSSFLPTKDLLVSSQPDRIRVGTLCGMGGLRKTEVAIEYSFSRQHLFDAVFWIRAEDLSKLEADIAQIAVRLGIVDPNEPDDKVINKGLAIEWLCNPYKICRTPENETRVRASWLIVFDNADEPDILAPFKDIVNSGAVLITSRSPLARTALSIHGVSCEIAPFDMDESAGFVQQSTGIKGHLEEAKDIGDRLGGLPLALAQMTDFTTSLKKLLIFMILCFSLFEKRPVETFQRSGHLGNCQTPREPFWRFLFLDPDCIQEDLLTKFAANVNNPDYPKKRGLFFAARKQLIGASLFRHNQETAEYWMHRVTQDPEKQLETFLSVVSIILEAWPTQGVGGHGITLWNKCEALYPHVISLQDAYRNYFSQEDAGDHFEFATLLSRAGWYQHSRGESHMVCPLLEMALKVCPHRSCEVDRDLESDIPYTLGAIANETNDAENCMKYTMEFLGIRSKVAKMTGEVDERRARAHNQIGIPLMMVGKYQEAEEAFSKSAQSYENIPDYTKDKRSLALVNLGLAYWLQGRLERASEVLELGLADREELYGLMDSHDFKTGRFLYALGNLRFSQGLLDESEEFHRRALQQFQSTIGNHHHRTADVCHRMAHHCLRKGLLDEATHFINQALKIWSIDTDKYENEIARTTYLKAKVIFTSGQEDEATRLFQSAALMRRKLTVLRSHEMDLTEHDFDCLVTFWSR
ncbi:hypothetical protein N7488_011568 [Penicillium malachiteum]|nr:hypothetical protein N7488_011568 [Penicillium malachiteum]